MKRIIGAVGVGNATFTAGQEAEFEAAVKQAHADKTGNIDLDRLETLGVIQGYGKAAKVEEAGASESAPAAAPAVAKKAARKKGH